MSHYIICRLILHTQYLRLIGDQGQVNYAVIVFSTTLFGLRATAITVKNNVTCYILAKVWTSSFVRNIRNYTFTVIYYYR